MGKLIAEQLFPEASECNTRRAQARYQCSEYLAAIAFLTGNNYQDSVFWIFH